MAKDDYFVIVYKILAYLYVKLKEGDPVDPQCLMHDGPLFKINDDYWAYIIETLLNRGYIRNVTITNAWGQKQIISNLGSAQITPEGIEYLCENSTLKKALKYLKEIKDITPFI